MTNKQYDLCLELFRRLQDVDVLQHLVLVGSWCLPLYKKYFEGVGSVPALRTRDIDFLIPLPLRLEKEVCLANSDGTLTEQFAGWYAELFAGLPKAPASNRGDQLHI